MFRVFDGEVMLNYTGRRSAAGRSFSAIMSMAILGGAVMATGPARAETLTQALIQAYNTNPQLLAARASLRSVDEQSAQAFSNWRPTIEGSGSIGGAYGATRVKVLGTSSSLASPKTLAISLTQSVWRGGRNFAQWRLAHNNIRAERARLFQTEQTVLLAAVTAYMDVVRDVSVVQLSINNERVLRRQLKATQDRFSVGEVTRTDVAQAQARLARAIADRIQNQGSLENSRATYRRVIGRLPGKLVTPTRLAIIPKRRAEVLRRARERNPDVLTAIFVELAARNNVTLIAGELLPSISISGSGSRTFDPLSSTFRGTTRSDSASITATLTVPLYQSGSVMSRVRAAKQTVWQRKNELANTRRTTVESATSAWQAFVTASSQERAFRSEARANAIALQGVQQEAQAGLRTVLDILDAEQELFTSRVNLVRAVHDRIVAIYQIRSAIGELTARSLKLRVNYYDPTKYYRAVRYKPWGLGGPTGTPPKAPAD